MAIGRLPEAGTGIPESIVDAKGDIITATASDTPARLAVGADDTALVADSTQSTGLAYKTKGVFNGLTTTGDMIYSSSGTTQARLGIGTNGQFLTTNGSIPSWGAAPSSEGFTLISSTSLSGASVTASSIPATYKHLMITFQKVYSNSNDYPMQFRMNSDSAAKYSFNGVYSYSGSVASNQSLTATEYQPFIRMRNASDANLNVFGTIWIYNYTTSTNKGMQTQFYSADSGGATAFSNTHGQYTTSSAISSFTAIAGGVNFSSGTMYIYGAN